MKKKEFENLICDDEKKMAALTFKIYKKAIPEIIRNYFTDARSCGNEQWFINNLYNVVFNIDIEHYSQAYSFKIEEFLKRKMLFPGIRGFLFKISLTENSNEIFLLFNNIKRHNFLFYLDEIFLFRKNKNIYKHCLEEI